MIKEVKTKQYKIAYAKCKKGGIHNDEPLNIVCLEPACSEHMLLCSICKTEQHAEHKTQPLKFYIDKLATTFAAEENTKAQLDALDERKNQLLATLQESVINISKKFQELEIEIIKRFNTAREKIQEIEDLRRSFEGIYDILSTPNHPDLTSTIVKYTNKPVAPTLPVVERISSLESSVVQQLNSAISFYADENAKFSPSVGVRVLSPPGIAFDGQNLQQIAGNTMNLCLLNEPITGENNKVKIKISTDKIHVAFGIISMAEFKKYGFVFDPTKATSNFVYWISSDGKGANYSSNSIATYAKQEIFDLSLKKNQLIINKRKSKQYAGFAVKDLGVDWYFFIALLAPGKVQILDKWGKK